MVCKRQTAQLLGQVRASPAESHAGIQAVREDSQGSGLWEASWKAQWSNCPLKGEQVSQVERRGSLKGSRREREEPGEGGLGTS